MFSRSFLPLQAGQFPRWRATIASSASQPPEPWGLARLRFHQSCPVNRQAKYRTADSGVQARQRRGESR